MSETWQACIVINYLWHTICMKRVRFRMWSTCWVLMFVLVVGRMLVVVNLTCWASCS